MRLLLVLTLLAKFGGIYGLWARYQPLTKTEREKICLTKDVKCIWLNDHLSRPHGLPLHSSLCCQCQPEVLCYDGPFTMDTLVRMWDRLTITIKTSRPATLALTYSNSSTRALSEGAPSRNLTSPLHLSPYGVHCVALERLGCRGRNDDVTEFSVDARLELWPVYPIVMSVCLFLLFTAPSLSRNVPLIYGTGITIGILASVLVLLYILSRYMPGKSFLGLGVLAGGYTIIGGLAYWFLNNMVDVVQEYWQYVLGYVITAGLISFAAIYYWGGVSNPRAFDLIQWTLQMIACAGIFMATRLTETSIAMIVMILFTYNVPLRYNPLFFPFSLALWMLRKVYSVLWRCVGPLPPLPVKRLLTAEEYEEQGRVETEKAMKHLRKYCLSNQKVVDKLKDTNRTRFEKFMSGATDHVTEDEEINHELTFMEDSDSDSDQGGTSVLDKSVSPIPASHRTRPPSSASRPPSSASRPPSSASHPPSSTSHSRSSSHFSSTPYSSPSQYARPHPSYQPTMYYTAQT